MRRPCLQNHQISLSIGFDQLIRSHKSCAIYYKKYITKLRKLLKDYVGYQDFDEENCQKAIKFLDEIEVEFHHLTRFFNTWLFYLYNNLSDQDSQVIDGTVEMSAKEWHDQLLCYTHPFPDFLHKKIKAINEILTTSGFIGLFRDIMESRENHPDIQEAFYQHQVFIWHNMETGFKRIQKLTTTRVYDPNNIQSRLWWSGQYHWSKEAILTEEELLELL